MFWVNKNNKNGTNKNNKKPDPIIYDSEIEYGSFEWDGNDFKSKRKLVSFGEFIFVFVASVDLLDRINLSINFIDENHKEHFLGSYYNSTSLDNFTAEYNIWLMKKFDAKIHKARNTIYFSEILSPSLNKVNNENIEKLEEQARELVKIQEAFDTHREELFEKRLLVRE